MQKTQQITPRQMQIIRLIAMGERTKEIARRLEISPKTVDSHVRAVMLLSGNNNRTATVIYVLFKRKISP